MPNPTSGVLTDGEVALLRGGEQYNQLSQEHFDIFLHAIARYRLNPFANQIYAVERSVKRGETRVKRITIQTGIDGFRLIADRTGHYAGSDDAVFDSEEDPTRAQVTVYKLVSGERCPFAASARWKEYYPGKKDGFMWDRMPHVMLAKCAEALALRKAFPAELSGLYTTEEMQQADTEPAKKPRKTPEKPSPKEPPQSPPPADQSPYDAATKRIGEVDTFWDWYRVKARVDKRADENKLNSFEATDLGHKLDEKRESWGDQKAQLDKCGEEIIAHIADREHGGRKVADDWSCYIEQDEKWSKSDKDQLRKTLQGACDELSKDHDEKVAKQRAQAASQGESTDGNPVDEAKQS